MSRFPSFRFRYSLRALAVVLTLFCLWGGYHGNRGLKTRRATRILEASGRASFEYVHHRNSQNLLKPDVLYETLVGVLWGDRAVIGATIDSDLNPEAARALGCLQRLETLHLFAPGFRGRAANGSPSWPPVAPLTGALKEVLAKKRLKTLYLRGFGISDTDCEAFTGAVKIEDVELLRVRLSHRGLSRVLSARGLSRIAIKVSELTSADFPIDIGSITLTSIKIEAPVGPNFASFVDACPRLTSLSLTGESIDDAFVVAIANHQSLETVALGNTSVGNAGILAVAQIASLQSLAIQTDKVSQEAIDSVRTLRPDLRLSCTPRPRGVKKGHSTFSPKNQNVPFVPK